MPQFLFVDQRWINVDKITSVQVRKDQASGELCCTIFFGSAGSESLSVEESKKVLEWLAANKATKP